MRNGFADASSQTMGLTRSSRASEISSSTSTACGTRARLYVAGIDGEPVGVGGLRPISAHEAEIKRMYVRPSSRGLGVGRAILQRLIDDARALGYTTIHLDSAPFMHEAHALYRRFGFVPSSPRKGWEFESVPVLHEIAVFMSLDLGAD